MIKIPFPFLRVNDYAGISPEKRIKKRNQKKTFVAPIDKSKPGEYRFFVDIKILSVRTVTSWLSFRLRSTGNGSEKPGSGCTNRAWKFFWCPILRT
jgi:hypothetical protein